MLTITQPAQRKHSHKSTAPASARTYCKRASSKNANTAVPERDRPRASQSPTRHETRAKHGQSRDERPSEQNRLSSAHALAQKHSTSKRTYLQASSKNANTAVPERDRPRASQSPTTHETRAKHGQSRDERPSEQNALGSAQALAQKHSTSKRTYNLQASIVQECQHRRARARQATRVTITNHTRDSSEARSVA